ncbi:MAG: LysE family transporter, partial [Lachnospiraceae bacterium]|nr:LysE family transporter [Lachnospiraceae bacterium]
MPLSIYISFVTYVCAVTIMPGPNNILLLSVAGQAGFRKCVSLLLGIWSGLIAVMLIAGGFCTILGSFIPSAAPFLKYVGAAYILYLAWLTLKKKPVSGDTKEDVPLSFRYGFLLQFLNVKVIMLGLAAFPGYFLPYGSSIFNILLFAVTMTVCCGIGNLIWTFFGSILNPFYGRHYRIINIVMAILLVYCAV